MSFPSDLEWDVVGGDIRLSGDVILYDDDGTHSAMTTAKLPARGVHIWKSSPLVDAVVGDHGVAANDEPYHQLVEGSSNLDELDHAAFISGTPQTVRTNPLRLCKDL